MPEDGDLRPDADLLGGFGAQPLPDRPEPKPRTEPVRSEPKPRNSSESGFESEVDDSPETTEKGYEHDKQGLELA